MAGDVHRSGRETAAACTDAVSVIGCLNQRADTARRATSDKKYL